MKPEPTTDSVDQFDRVVAMLADLDWDVIRDAATDTERRALLDEFLVRLDVHPDHLEVNIRGAGKLNVALHEVGLRSKTVEITGVGGPTPTIPYHPLATRYPSREPWCRRGDLNPHVLADTSPSS